MNISTKLALIVVSIFSLMAACKEAELPVPTDRTPETQQPSPGTPAPGTPLPETPAPLPPKPADPVPAEPSIPGVLRKIKWAPLDFKQFDYNQQGSLIKYTRQYNNVQGTDIVQRDIYRYTYDAAGRLLKVNNENGLYTEYSYTGDVWSEAMTYDRNDKPLRKYKFKFGSDKQLLEYEEFYATPDGITSPRSRTNFTYNAAGNLVRYKYFWYVESSQSFVPSTEIAFSNFDNKKYPKNADSFDYVLQPLSFFVNNPGKKELISSYAPTEFYSYTYDAYGYPTGKHTSYSYDKPIPSTQLTFEY